MTRLIFNRFTSLFLLAFFIGFGLSAQDYPMIDGSISTCQGIFFDDATGGDYTPTTYTYTICPDNPGDVISLTFATFDLQTAPNNGSDLFVVYDSDGTGGNQAIYTGGDLAGITIFASINNPSGCLTINFVSQTGNTQGHSGWSAQIECTTPCANPTSITEITSPALPVAGLDSVSICVGDQVTFTDGGSTVEPGFVIENHIWDFDDGDIDSLNNTTVTHTFNAGGQYLVNHFVVDDNGCISQNADPMIVVVSTLPLFTLDFPDTICVGSPADLIGQAEGILWTSAPPVIFSGQTYLSDSQGDTFENTLFVDFFEEGQVVEDCEDIIQINLNIEHSYLGDLAMWIECPDGTTVDLLTFPNDGGGTFLGEAVDAFPQTASAGLGYDYGWSSNSSMGFIDDNANSTSINYINTDGADVTANVVDAGIYQAEGDLCDLVGCPLNGTWTFNVTDNLGIDDGNIFSWGVDFAAELFPDVTTFTPIYGPDSDSTFWNADPNLSVSTDGNSAVFNPPAPGQYDLTYTAINDFGCSVDTTVTIEVFEMPEIAASPDTDIECGGGTQLGVGLASPPDPFCDFSLVLEDFFNDGWDGSSIDLSIDGGAPTNYTLAGVGGETIPLLGIGHGVPFQITFNAGGGGDDYQINFLILNGQGEQLFGQGFSINGETPADGQVYNGVFSCVESLNGFNFEWSPASFLDDPTLQFPIADGVTLSTWFTVIVSEEDNPDCYQVDSMLLNIPNASDAGLDLAACAMTYQLNGFTQGSPVWTADDPGITFSDPNSYAPTVTSTVDGLHEVYIEDMDGLSCPNRDTILIAFFDSIAFNPQITPPLCFGECNGELLVTPTGGNVQPGTTYGYQFSSGTTTTPNELVDLCDGTVTVLITDNDGCFSTNNYDIVEPPAPIIDSLTVTEESCANYCDGEVIVHSAVAQSYSYDGGATFSLSGTNSTFCPGTYSIIIQDPNGCQGVDVATILAGDEPSADFIAEPVRASVLEPKFEFFNSSVDNVENQWYFGEAGIHGESNEENPLIFINGDPGLYPIELIVTDTLGCLDTLIKFVEVVDEFQIFIPTAFSPNGDDINDSFELIINDLDPSDYQFEVVDRWGAKVFVSDRYPTRWNGESNTDYEYYVADGVYTWMINARALSSSERREFTGSVTIIR